MYCDSCKKAWLPSDEGIGEHPNHLGESIELTGIDMIKDFVTEDEEEWLRDQVDKTAWVDSQSGRRKQVGNLYKDIYGNSCNCLNHNC